MALYDISELEICVKCEQNGRIVELNNGLCPVCDVADGRRTVMLFKLIPRPKTQVRRPDPVGAEQGR